MYKRILVPMDGSARAGIVITCPSLVSRISLIREYKLISEPCLTGWKAITSNISLSKRKFWKQHSIWQLQAQ